MIAYIWPLLIVPLLVVTGMAATDQILAWISAFFSTLRQMFE